MHVVDWDNVQKHQIADICGRDPMMWAEAFCHYAKTIGVDLGDDPAGWIVGWFSAAMQAETDHMTPEQHEREAREQRRVKCPQQAAMKGAMMSTSAATTGTTAVCKYCGRPIIGTPMRIGGAGDVYHAECTMPRRRATLEDVRTFILEKRAEGLSDRQILELLF